MATHITVTVAVDLDRCQGHGKCYRMATHITVTVAVDLDRCQGHGKCYLLAPRVFAPIADDDWGKAEVLVGPIAEGDTELLAQAETGLRACPESAIALTQNAAHEPSHS